MLAAMTIGGCSDEITRPGDESAGRIELTCRIDQEAGSRVNDDGFADGDVIGIYIVDYRATEPGELLNSGNHADNVGHTYDAASGRWQSNFDLYWTDDHTRIDVYGYYPYGSPDDVNDYRFCVSTTQSRVPADGTMGDYEASDFLWGMAGGIEPTTRAISVAMRHRMANARITLVEGSGFAEGEWAETDKQIVVANTVTEATIDLSTGTVAPVADGATAAINPMKTGNEWRAIVVPQTIPGGTSLMNISIGGMPYRFAKNEDFSYAAGKMSNFSIRVDKKEETGDYMLTLIAESISPWESDPVSHDGSTMQYISVNSTPGGLKDAIKATGLDYRKIQNLKITGRINRDDFYFMRDSMEIISAINLKEVIIEGIDGSSFYKPKCFDDQIPTKAFDHKTSLTHIILPDRLKTIASYAFYFCSNLTGSLVIPEGVEDIYNAAFGGCTGLTGTLSLPSTLRYIGSNQDSSSGTVSDRNPDSGYGAFKDCGFTCQLMLPDGLEFIGASTFNGCSSLYGSLRLPQSLKSVGYRSFCGCKGLSGSLEVPQTVTKIGFEAFNNCGFDGTLQLPDGLTYIGEGAFKLCSFRGELVISKNLTTLNQEAFLGNRFSSIVLPQSLVSIGNNVFSKNDCLRGTLNFPDNLISIGESAFAYCSSIERIVFPENLENIKSQAFKNCTGLQAIECQGYTPPNVQQNAFDGIAKDNFILEVPEQAVVQYQTSAGWRDFKRIAGHHEITCRPAIACALGSAHEQTLIIDAEGEWEVESKPDWCQLSQSSGNKKTEITLTISEFGNSGRREGDIVFNLKDFDYTHTCHVVQHGYSYTEDQFISLQTATKGSGTGINIVILGDGYDAGQIASGSYLSDMKQAAEHFFGVEPYSTYRGYFNVYTAFPVSTESGVGTVNNICYNRFNTTFTGSTGLKCDYDEVFEYALGAPGVNASNLDRTLIIVVPNTSEYGGITQMWESGAAIALCPKSNYEYPYDWRGIIQHEAGGHGFGKLADEYIYHNAFIDGCNCSCCKHAEELRRGKALGWYDNLELTGKPGEVGWKHLIFDPRYSDIADIYEGGFMHSRGVYRSEQNSCMNNNIPYFSTISRQSIVKRIKHLAGETFDFEDFVALDNRGAATSRSTAAALRRDGAPHQQPMIHRGSLRLHSDKSTRK